MRPALALLALASLLACPRPQQPAPPPAPPPVPAAPAPEPLHELELRRDSAALIARLTDPDPRPIVLALARVGDTPALTSLLTLLRGDDPALREHAARALGIAALLDADPTDLEPALLAAWPRAGLDERVAIAEALGRLGTPAALPTLTDAIAVPQPLALRSAATLALGILGRRKQPLDAPTRAALLAQLGEQSLLEATHYALAHEHEAPADPALLARLRRCVQTCADPTQRLALAATIRRSPAPPLQTCLARALPDAARDPQRLTTLLGPDRDAAVTTTLAWARSLVDDHALDERRALALTRQLHAALDCLTAETAAPTAPERRALGELLARISPAATAITAALTGPERNEPHAQALAPWRHSRQHELLQIHCLLHQRLAHDPTWRLPLACDVSLIGQSQQLIHQLVPLAHGFGGDWPARSAQLDHALTDTDPTVRIAAVTAIAPLWDDPLTAPSVETWLQRALDDRSAGVVGTALDVIAARFSRPDHKPPAPDAPLARHLLARLGAAPDAGPAPPPLDPELHSQLLATLAATRLPAALPPCQAAREHPSPPVRKAARACVQQLTGADPGPATTPTVLPRPPVDPRGVLGKPIRWQLATTHGPIDVILDPAAAPWAVATIVALTLARKYDGLIFHRDVRGFVLQGGDPEGTGWGGPGFVLPSEPGPHRFDRGAVGIADAGKDTGGSQFFFMHAPAPHLEGRYTWVGHVVPEHLERLDQLSLGDRIGAARLILPPP